MSYIERLNQTKKELSEAYNKETDRSRKRELGKMLMKVLEAICEYNIHEATRQ